VRVAGQMLDMRQPLGPASEGAGLCPVELLAAALGSCIHLTMAAVAEAKGISLGKLEVSLRLEDEDAIEEGRTARAQVEVVFDGGLTERERKILFRSGRLCPLRKLVGDRIEFADDCRVRP